MRDPYITETPDMQQQSDDVMKANSKTAEENMVVTWSFLQQERIYNESKEKQTRNQCHFPGFKDRLKRFYFPTIPLWTKIVQIKVKKNKSNENFEQSLQKPISMLKQRNVSK